MMKMRYNAHIETDKELNIMSIYVDNGYKNRKDYLTCLAEDYGVDYELVATLADLLGPTEDFDGLVVMIEDMEDM